MTQDEIIRMAREAGLWPGVTDVFPKELERFAALVAAHEREKQAEQEPVAKYQGTDSEYNYHIVKLYEDLSEGALLYAAPVQQVDLTDDEILEIVFKLEGIGVSDYVHAARAVIAADREKNK